MRWSCDTGFDYSLTVELSPFTGALPHQVGYRTRVDVPRSRAGPSLPATISVARSRRSRMPPVCVLHSAVYRPPPDLPFDALGPGCALSGFPSCAVPQRAGERVRPGCGPWNREALRLEVGSLPILLMEHVKAGRGEPVFGLPKLHLRTIGASELAGSGASSF